MIYLWCWIVYESFLAVQTHLQMFLMKFDIFGAISDELRTHSALFWQALGPGYLEVHILQRPEPI